MSGEHFHLVGELNPWRSKERLAALLRDAGFNVVVGRYSIRLQDCCHFAFQEYGGDLGDPQLEADAQSADELRDVATRVSAAFARAGIRHRFEMYDEEDNLRDYFHHGWPQ